VRRAASLTSAIQAGTLVWRKTAGGAVQTPADYDPDYLDIVGENTGKADRVVDSIQVNGDASLRNVILPSTPVARTTNGTLNLTDQSNSAQLITGDNTGYSVVLPDATTLPQGHKYEIYNTGNTTMLVKSFGGATLFTLSQNSTAYLYLRDNSSEAGIWLAWQIISDANIASGIVNYKVTSATPFATTSATDVLITGFTVTPQAGTYAVWFNGEVIIGSNNTDMFCTVYNGGVAITDSQRSAQGVGSNWNGTISTMTTSQFNGTNACDVRVRRTGGNLTINQRSLILIRLGN